MSSTDSPLEMIRRELSRYPFAVSAEFHKATEAMEAALPPARLEEWIAEGATMARQTVRSWEAAAEFFRVSPVVLPGVTFPSLMEWGRWGTVLCQDSPTIGIAYFRASPEALALMGVQHIPAWASLGRSLYKGTWKSTTLAARFFETSPALLKTLAFQELAQFTQAIEALSHRSYDLALECMALGRDTFPRMQGEHAAFIAILATLVEGSWRQAKDSFEAAVHALANVEQGERQRFLHIARQVSRRESGSLPGFLAEAGEALGLMERDTHASILGMAEALADPAPATVVEFLKSCPTVLDRVTQEQLALWFEEGMRLVQEHGDGGRAYFRIESARSEEILDILSSSVELDRIKDVVRMYCRALAGETVDVALAQELVDKGIGWVSKEHPTTEGTKVFLPPLVDRYPTKEQNFLWYKVVSTHQVAHLEFGSFQFEFARPSTLFENLRPLLSSAGPEEESAPPSTNGAQPAGLTDISRFFDLFKDRQLALDIFTIVEDARLDYLVKGGYQGLRASYQQVQQDALQERPALASLPAREALVEFLVQMSLGAQDHPGMPQEYADAAGSMRRIVGQLLQPGAQVEDAAEATVHIYQVLSQVANEESGQGQSTTSEQGMDQPQGEDQEDSTDEEDAEGPQERPYRSPQSVEYRGEFKPELTQLLAHLRSSQEQAGAQQSTEMQSATQMELEELLRRSKEADFRLAGGEVPRNVLGLVSNLLKEAGLPPDLQDFPTDLFTHSSDEEGSLEATEPQTFLYDEWDFRAGDYKPRWCIVREKPLAEGDATFYQATLQSHASLVTRVQRQFERVLPEAFRKIKRLPDGEEFDLDSVIEAIIDRKSGASPSDKLYWRRNKVIRDVAVVFLLDMSASTAEAIEETHRYAHRWDAPQDPREYMLWLRARRAQGTRRSYKRIIDVEKESTVILIRALETIGDPYGIYGFSGYGRENVEFYVIKDIEEPFSDRVSRRIDKIAPLHATRMGPAIRHATTKLARQDARTKILFLISDGRPQDRGYSREGVEKEYAVHDTKVALTEARRQEIIPFCLTVDKAGHDYLKTMMADMGYEVLGDITQLPERLPYLYRKLTTG